MQKGRRAGIIFLSVFLLILIVSAPVFGASYKSQWKNVKGKYYYWGANRKKVKGLQKIGKKTYYFDSKYVQRTGWRKIKGSYYFFRQVDGKKGYMLTSTTVNGIKLKSNGKASYSSRGLRKLKLMVRCSEIVDSQTNANQTKAQKLAVMFDYAKNHYRARNIGGFRSGGDWDMFYAEYMLNYGSGDCYCYGALFAYFANAVGYQTATAVSSGGHGWAEINGLSYDPNWARVIGTSKCYAVPASLSGRDGRPAWATYGIYKKNLKYLN